MTSIRIRDPEQRISAALATAERTLPEPVITLRELLTALGEQGMLVFCGVLAAPFLLPVTAPGLSTALGVPMLLIAFAVIASRVPWLPERLLGRGLSSATVREVLLKVRGWALKTEHLIRPRLLALSGNRRINVVNGAALVIAVLVLMAPLPLVPFANTLPAMAIMLLCFGMAERDGAVIALGWLATLVSTAYVGAILWLVVYAGMHAEEALDVLRRLFS